MNETGQSLIDVILHTLLMFEMMYSVMDCHLQVIFPAQLILLSFSFLSCICDFYVSMLFIIILCHMLYHQAPFL